MIFLCSSILLASMLATLYNIIWSSHGPTRLQGGNWLWEARAMQGQPAEVREALQQAKRAVEPSTAATSLGDRLVDTLTAQSLDLPPQAAKVCTNLPARTLSQSLAVQVS